jgi:hypothetical protein
MLHAGLEFLAALECSVCGQIVYAESVTASSLHAFLLRLKLERFAVCPCCTQDVSGEKQKDSAYQQRWWSFAKALIADHKRDVKWYKFKQPG